MKCTNNIKITTISLLSSLSLVGCTSSEVLSKLEISEYNKSLYQEELFSTDIITAVDEVSYSSYENTEEIFATALFELSTSTVLQSKNLLESLAPASTTKVMTAYVALKYGNIEDIITVSETALDLPSDSSMAGLEVGDMVTLYDLLVGLTSRSGNDAAIAIAEHISGSVPAFAELMTREAIALGATNTSFKNPHGLDETGHYTTLYDLYLMFNAAIKYPEYKDILNDTSYITTIKNIDGSERQVEWVPTNQYHNGKAKSPDNFVVIGGKTGTTSLAKNCLVMLMENSIGEEYVVITMGATTRDVLYSKMTELIELVPNE